MEYLAYWYEENIPILDRAIGSNNWAVSGKRTAHGNPILANDPHLGLNLPNIWYVMQLSGPDKKNKDKGKPRGTRENI